MIIKIKEMSGSPKFEKLAKTKSSDIEKIAQEISKIRTDPKSAKKHVPISIRLDPETLMFFKSGGMGWQSRINAVLADYVLAQKKG
jgi:uncharacterized protein (DUF4415 family)